MALEVGQEAPDFSLPSHEGETVTLSELRGTPVVIAFFPLAFSGVCTRQFEGLGGSADAYGAGSARVLAISVDHSNSQRAFAEQVGAEGVTFLSDFLPRGLVAQAYGTFVEERGHSGRAWIVVDADGIVRDVHHGPPLEVPDAGAIRAAVEACSPS